LPSYVSTVEEYASVANFPVTGGGTVIYIALDTNLTYRWTGTQYVEIGDGNLNIGETSTTAYRGDRGKVAYDHSFITTGNPHNVKANEIFYDNSNSGLSNNTVQGVVDELVKFFEWAL